LKRDLFEATGNLTVNGTGGTVNTKIIGTATGGEEWAVVTWLGTETGNFTITGACAFDKTNATSLYVKKS
jgi:hypothetical protein